MTVGSKVRCGEGGAVWKVRSGRWAGAGRGKTLRPCKGLRFYSQCLGKPSLRFLVQPGAGAFHFHSNTDVQCGGH